MTGNCVSGLYESLDFCVQYGEEICIFLPSSPGNSGDELDLDLLGDSKMVLST